MAMAARVTVVEVEEDILPVGAIDPDDVHTEGSSCTGSSRSHRHPRAGGHSVQGASADEREGERADPPADVDRLAMEFGDGWIVNLGIGIPTLCSNFDFDDRQIIFHSENGVIGYGPLAAPGEEDLHLVNAGGQHVRLQPGAAIVHHAEFLRADPQRSDRRDRARRL